MRHIYPYNYLVAQGVLPAGLDHEQQKAFYNCFAAKVNATYATMDQFFNAILADTSDMSQIRRLESQCANDLFSWVVTEVDVIETVPATPAATAQTPAAPKTAAGRITAVIPYFGYARQDRKAKARDPISAKLVANLLTVAGADRVLTMDLHAAQIQGFFDIPVDNLYGAPLFATHYLRRFGYGREDMVVVSPDVGSVARARSFAMKMGLGLAIVDKRREKANSSEVMNIIGNVEGKTCLLLDDMVDTAGSLCGAAKAIVEVGGAKEVYACASHGVLSGPAIDRINDSVIDELLLLDSIPYPKDKPACDKIHYLPVAPMFAEAINRIYEEMSISSLFE